jgi:hypothetical protein
MAHRVTVDFSNEACEAIDTILKELNPSKSEGLRRARGLWRFVLKENKEQS